MMDAMEPWVRDALTAEVEETANEFIWNGVVRWLYGESISSFEARCDEMVFGRQYLLEHILGGDTVRSIWGRVRRRIYAEVAAEARRVVPNDVVRKWLAWATSENQPDRVPVAEVEEDDTPGYVWDTFVTDPNSLGEHVEAEDGDVPDDVWDCFRTDPNSPIEQVLDGLHLLMSVADDRDLADQLGLADASDRLPRWLLPPSRWLTVAPS